jgi:hypothetical protein
MANPNCGLMAKSYKESRPEGATGIVNLILGETVQPVHLESEIPVSLEIRMEQELPRTDELFRQFPDVPVQQLIQSIEQNPGDANRLIDVPFLDSLFSQLRESEKLHHISLAFDMVVILCYATRLSRFARLMCFEMLDVLLDLTRRFFDSYEVRQGLIDVVCIAAAHAISMDIGMQFGELRNLTEILLMNLRSYPKYDDLQRVVKFFEALFVNHDYRDFTNLLTEDDMRTVFDVSIGHLADSIEKKTDIHFILWIAKNLNDTDREFWSEILTELEQIEFRDPLEKEELYEIISEKMKE